MRRDGAWANAGLRWQVGQGLVFSADWNVQDFRHSAFRNDVLTRFIVRNCPDPAGPCGFHRPNLFSSSSIPPADGSWSWFGAQADFDLSRHWAVFVRVEGGGSRDWTTADWGLRYRF